MVSIADLRKQRTTDFGSITAALNKKTEYARDDEGFWKPERDKAGNGSAVIRFLPKHPDDELPWVTLYTHAFQGPAGKWYIENCLSTIGQDDPVNVANRALYATGLESDKKEAGKRKRKTNYIVNILIVSDPKHPENDGKVFKFKFGKKIYDKIMDKVQPTFEDETPLNVFDLWDGADFKLRIQQVEGFPNYDKSVFSAPQPISEDDAELEKIVKQMTPLKDIVALNKFKSYAELEKKFNSIISGQVGSTAKAEELVEQMRNEPVREASKPARVIPDKATVIAAADEEDLEDYFKSLAE